MDASAFQIVAAAGAVGFVAAVAVIARQRSNGAGAYLWTAPAVLSLLFLLWSVYAVVTEGPLGFWAQHTRDAWGVQIWLDLLLSIGVGFALLAPASRRVGMRPTPWLILILCTGSVGVLAMLARYLFLREHTAAPAPATT